MALCFHGLREQGGFGDKLERRTPSLGRVGWLQSPGNPPRFYIPCLPASGIPTLSCVWEMVLEFS